MQMHFADNLFKNIIAKLEIVHNKQSSSFDTMLSTVFNNRLFYKYEMSMFLPGFFKIVDLRFIVSRKGFIQCSDIIKNCLRQS